MIDGTTSGPFDFAHCMRVKEKAMVRTSTLAGAISIMLALCSPPAMAKGCLKGGAVGGVAGHLAGKHGALGAAAGCVVGHHQANKQQNQQQQNSNSR
jgi:hypothetical protein